MRKQPTVGSLRLFWAQQIVTLIILGAVVHVQNGNAPAQPDAMSQYGWFMVGLAVMLIAGGLFFRVAKAGTHALPFLISRSDVVWGEGWNADQREAIKHEAMLRYKTATIMGTACAESAALCGFVLAFMSKMTAIYLPFAGAAAAVILWQLPNQQSLDAICASLSKKKSAG